jgi:2-polyprenyl-3-methyl-5-hydroxy-6-metoxy-1,4-benzoquinol methylase
MIKIKIEKEKWNIAQDGELRFHIKNEWRKNNEEFTKSNTALFKNHFNFNENDYINKNVLDLGCGSKLRSKFFKDSFIYALEPLANKFIEEIEWCDLKDAHKVYSLPAEQMVEELVGEMDLVFSINVIDHCYDFDVIVDNLYKYTKSDGLCLLSFDLHDKIDPMHPIILTDEFACETFERIGFKITKKMETTSYHKGISELAMTYYLTKK